MPSLDEGSGHVSRFKRQGRVYVSGNVLKFEFDNGGHKPLRFFCFVDDVDKLLDGQRDDVVIYLDQPRNT